MIQRLADSILLAFERIWQHRILVFWTLVGLSAATTLALSLMLYVDAVNTNLLTDNLGTPPYAFRFRYLGSWEGNITTDDLARTDAAIRDDFVNTIGLPTVTQVQYTSLGGWTLLRENARYGVYTLGTLQGSDSQIQITAGHWPPLEPSDNIPVLMPEKLFYTTGLQVGDTLSAQRSGGTPVTLEIAAMWRPINPDDPMWIFTPKFFDQVLLLEDATLLMLAETFENPIEEAGWYIVFKGNNLRTGDIANLLTDIADGQRVVEQALPGIRTDLSPETGLEAFNEQVKQLTQQLIIVVLPIAGLILYFVTMLSDMLVGRQRQEDVVLSSRGISRRGLLGIHFLMWLILASIALMIGMGFAPSIVQLVGQTTSFLRFDNQESKLTMLFTSQVLLAGGFTAVIAVSNGLYLAWRTTGQSMTSFKQSQARGSQAWWQRFYFDILLLIPAVYMFYTLNAEGGISTTAEDPFSDPLVFIAPTLFSFGMTLVFLRVYPWLLNVIARLLALTNNIALLMALRELTRSMSRYRSTLLMMCFTLSLIGFTASMASTLDRSLEDVIYYRIGADSVLVVASDTQTEETANDDGTTTLNVVGYNTLPVSNLLELEDIHYASRVGRYPIQLTLARQRIPGTFIGVDRGAIAAVAHFRDDYAGEPLADLLNKLAVNRTGVIINRRTAETYGLVIGQEINLQVLALNTTYQTKVQILGFVDYFPTIDPRETFFVIGNLDPIFELVGTELPYDIWLSLGTDLDEIKNDVTALGYPILTWRSPEEALYQAQTAPSRRGILGFLSVGFIASIALTLVGSVIQSTASFRAQAIQLGSLRAMGLSGRAVNTYLIASQGISSIGGIVGGTFIGIATTLLFLPLLDFSGGLPPYLVRVAWDQIAVVYGVFAATLVGLTILTTILLSKQHVSQLVKLGDA